MAERLIGFDKDKRSKGRICSMAAESRLPEKRESKVRLADPRRAYANRGGAARLRKQRRDYATPSLHG